MKKIAGENFPRGTGLIFKMAEGNIRKMKIEDYKVLLKKTKSGIVLFGTKV